jgi:DNA-binding LacI/PurR family transcriptional regulator
VVDPSPDDPWVSLLHGRGLPVVTIERDLGRPDDPWYVASDVEVSTRQMLDHLSACGAERIALLVPTSRWGWATETLVAYQAWVAEHGLEPWVVPVAMPPAARRGPSAGRGVRRCRPVRSGRLASREGERQESAGRPAHRGRRGQRAVT